jgi:hypothetical protein
VVAAFARPETWREVLPTTYAKQHRTNREVRVKQSARGGGGEIDGVPTRCAFSRTRAAAAAGSRGRRSNPRAASLAATTRRRTGSSVRRASFVAVASARKSGSEPFFAFAARAQRQCLQAIFWTRLASEHTLAAYADLLQF